MPHLPLQILFSSHVLLYPPYFRLSFSALSINDGLGSCSAPIEQCVLAFFLRPVLHYNLLWHYSELWPFPTPPFSFLPPHLSFSSKAIFFTSLEPKMETVLLCVCLNTRAFMYYNPSEGSTCQITPLNEIEQK